MFFVLSALVSVVPDWGITRLTLTSVSSEKIEASDAECWY